MDSTQFRAAATAAIDDIATYYDTIADRPVLPSVTPGYLHALIPDAAPEDGESWDTIQADIERVIMPGLTHWQSPHFMAFFPCNSSFPAMLGDMYSGAFNAAAFNWICSPAVTELETVVMDWVARLLGLPDAFLSKGEGGGIIQGTASEVIVTAVVAARERVIRRRLAHMPEGEEKMDAAADLRGKMVALGSEHAHSSTQKAAIIAGTRFRTVPAPAESNYSVTAAALQNTIRECEAKGLIPFYFTATLGSTATCAIDDLTGIAALAPSHPDLWIHVDAAYAGSALVLPEYQHLCPPMSAFSSFNVNLHKWLLVNFDCSAFFISRRADLIDTFSITPSYLRNSYTESGLVTDYRDWQIPLGRRFRALKVWFVLRSYGASGLRAFIQSHIKLGEGFAALVKSRPDLFKLTTDAAFGLTTFQVLPQSAPDNGTVDQSACNAATQRVYEAINAAGEFYISSSVICGTYIIRIVSANTAAEEKYLTAVFERLVDAAEADRRALVVDESEGKK
ncbi:pyridoxal phosphate-dependent transferase [Boeremia exigua]|uniref:pyridoxal phosphate-dependent transferase n=1 Tax=Boeremia exigua TaxID=749465 RepID=UPI001E8DB5DE|nr:pyridoxal phosphate-dependent transferase [Boeremia exigua]KAH6625179.1 pyridoxal phosphate-dependent transferase [Boeremia exigua]